MFAPDLLRCQAMRSFSLSFCLEYSKISELERYPVFFFPEKEGLALFYVLVMMTRGGRDMKTFLCPLILLALCAGCLSGCLQEDSFDSVRVDGEMSTVFRTGSGPSLMHSRTRTGISF